MIVKDRFACCLALLQCNLSVLEILDAFGVQQDLGDTNLADQLPLEMISLLKHMDSLHMLLLYSQQNLERMTVSMLGQRNPDYNYFEEQTEFGQFAREVSLAMKSLQFEVKICLTSTAALKYLLRLNFSLNLESWRFQNNPFSAHSWP